MTVSQKIKHYLWIFIEYFSLIFFSFVALLPVVSCVITAFKTETEYQNTNVMTLPESWLNFDNFIQAFNKANMGRAFINSFIVLVFVVFGSVMVGSMLAYVLNRFKFPLLKPAIVTVMILKGVGTYNEYYNASLYLSDPKLKTIAISLYTFVGPLGSKYNLICAGVIISLIPALVVFLIFQKQIYSGLTAGAVKG